MRKYEGGTHIRCLYICMIIDHHLVQIKLQIGPTVPKLSQLIIHLSWLHLIECGNEGQSHTGCWPRKIIVDFQNSQTTTQLE